MGRDIRWHRDHALQTKTHYLVNVTSPMLVYSGCGVKFRMVNPRINHML
jgi:hypothetical protein